MVILLKEKRLLERSGAGKTVDIENVGEIETFFTLVIGIEVSLVTCTNLRGEDIREVSIKELLVIWSVSPKSITQVLDVVEINVKLELPS